MNDNISFPVAIALLGIAAMAGFMAFRPWPQPNSKPIEPGSYAVSILQGNIPAASKVDRSGDITTIQTGLMALLGIWTANKLAGMLSNLGGPSGGAGASDEAQSDGTSAGDEIENDVKADLPVAEDVAGDVAA